MAALTVVVRLNSFLVVVASGFSVGCMACPPECSAEASHEPGFVGGYVDTFVSLNDERPGVKSTAPACKTLDRENHSSTQS
jgi:hypothetical protein